MSLKVLKFGGSSVGSAEALRRAATIVRDELPQGGLVVVSALRGTTDGILEACAAAGRGDLASAQAVLSALRARHQDVATELGHFPAVEVPWEALFTRLDQFLTGMAMLGEATARARDGALAVGETLSAHLAAQCFNGSFRDVREVMKTDARFGKARPLLSHIREAAAPWRAELAQGPLWVTQGFLGSSPEGVTTTLGRGGSDTSATLLGEALDAEEVQIWTDVDGVLSADPSLVKEARPIPQMSLSEAEALSAFGAKVLHADSLAPGGRGGFRLVVANTHRPSASRTVILPIPPERPAGSVTSVAYKEGIYLLRFPASAGLEPPMEAARRLEEAGALRFGLISSPAGTLLAVRPETHAAAEVLGTLAASGLACEAGWAVIALVGEGLRADPLAALRHLGELGQEPVGGLLTGSSTVSLAFLVQESRLSSLIPRLHSRCVLGY
ncbi:MAG: aspartate kinase [Holophagaceae bacterium]|uniref:Aspartokinase n=1 Tax=Candidatus Geothrix skivensis TaxID=2954439 RepID=A0A9D7XMR4_9BACT|nr:aspartate kinase [Candidatus Geothrix skivensis]